MYTVEFLIEKVESKIKTKSSHVEQNCHESHGSPFNEINDLKECLKKLNNLKSNGHLYTIEEIYEPTILEEGQLVVNRNNNIFVVNKNFINSYSTSIPELRMKVTLCILEKVNKENIS